MAEDENRLALRQAHVARAQCLASLATMDALILGLTPAAEAVESKPRSPRTLGEDDATGATGAST
jgi:hypothetical protein